MPNKGINIGCIRNSSTRCIYVEEKHVYPERIRLHDDALLCGEVYEKTEKCILRCLYNTSVCIYTYTKYKL